MRPYLRYFTKTNRLDSSHTKVEVMNMREYMPEDIAKDVNYDFDFDIQACSPTDCTGLIPAGPVSDVEIENYNQLYKFMPGTVERAPFTT